MPEPTDSETPQLHVDTDWKAEAQAEKERLAADQTAKADERADSRRELPEANFASLVGVLASQALMGLGTMQDPETKGIMIDLEGSRFSIELLGVLEKTTSGNLTEKEAEELGGVLTELRARFVQVKQVMDQQAAAAGGAPNPLSVE